MRCSGSRKTSESQAKACALPRRVGDGRAANDIMSLRDDRTVAVPAMVTCK